MKKTTTDSPKYFGLSVIKLHAYVLIFLIALMANHVSAQVESTSWGFNYLDRPYEQDPYLGSGYSVYAAVFSMLEQYPGSRNFQSGVLSTWLSPYRDNDEKSIYNTIEGGLGWWHDTRFGTVTPKFIMGGVANGFAQWANGVGAGSTSMIGGGRRDWSEPGGKYGVAQLANNLLWPPDGLTMEQGANGEYLGYGYRPLPITDYMPTTYGVNMSTGNQCWALFLNTANYKGPITFIIPTFWTETTLHDPSLEGLFFDQRPSRQNGYGVEFASSPAKIGFANEDTFARMVPLRYPVSSNNRTDLARDPKMYTQPSTYWNDVENWFNGGQVAPTEFNPADMTGVNWKTGGSCDAHIKTTSNTSVEAKIDMSSFATKFNSSDQTVAGFEFDLSKVKQDKGMFELPEYYKLDQNNEWQPIDQTQVPVATGLQTNGPTITPRPDISYLTPLEKDCHHQDPDGPWSSPGPSSGPYTAYLGDGTQLTYYWYKFIDQPAMIHANLPAAMRLKIQARVEKIHRHWKSTDDYLPNPTGGKLVGLDAGQIVTPPAGMEIGYVAIVTRQERGVSTTDCNGDANGTAFLDACNICVGGNSGKSETVNGIPEGYIYLGDEGDTKTLPSTSDVAYGHGCGFTYLFNVSGSVAINNGTFGGDPAPGVPKKSYYKTVGVTTSIDTETTGNSLSIYPKHAQNQVNIEGRFSHWILTDVLGAVVKRGAEKVINVAQLNRGLYYLIIDGEVMKFIKI